MQLEARILKRQTLKKDLIVIQAASDLTIPDDIYELWKLNRGRMSINAVRPAPLSRRDLIEPYNWERAEWIKTNMQCVKDKLYPAYIDKLRQKTDSLLHGREIGRRDRPLDLHPPGFEAKKFPCLMFGGANSRSIGMTLPLGSDLEKAVSSCLDKPVTMSAKALRKNVSAKVITETIIPIPIIPIPMEGESDSDHEKTVFIDCETGNPKPTLYRKTEKAEPIAYICAGFLRVLQSARDNIGPDTLTDEAAAAISLEDNAQISPTLITAKGALRPKKNLEASTGDTQRHSGKFGGYTGATATTGADILRSRALNLRRKGMQRPWQSIGQARTPTQTAPRPTMQFQQPHMNPEQAVREIHQFHQHHTVQVQTTAENLVGGGDRRVIVRSHNTKQLAPAICVGSTAAIFLLHKICAVEGAIAPSNLAACS